MGGGAWAVVAAYLCFLLYSENLIRYSAGGIIGLQSLLGLWLTFKQASRVDRPPPTLSLATTASLPATQGQR
jgi:hypothetical protein